MAGAYEVLDFVQGSLAYSVWTMLGCGWGCDMLRTDGPDGLFTVLPPSLCP